MTADPQNPGGWDGCPENPEWSGPHQITRSSEDWPARGPWVLLWCAQERLWTDLFGNREPPEAMARHRYLGPCLTPAEVAAREAAARREGIEAAAKWHDEEGQRIADEAERFMPRENGFHERSVAAIRALLEDGR